MQSYHIYQPVLLVLCILFAISCNRTQEVTEKKTESLMSGNGQKSHLGYQSKQIQLNNLMFNYVEAGSGELMVFLHGFPFFGESWDKLLRPLSTSFHVVAPDQRGYGYTEKPEDVSDYRIGKLVEDVRQLITKLSPNKKAIIVGHDWGGVMAWGVAQQYPELVSKVIVINAPPFNAFVKMLVESRSQRDASSYINKLSSLLARIYFAIKGPELLWGAGLEKMYADGHVNDDFKRAFIAAWSEKGAAQGAVNWYKANIPEFDEIDQTTYWPSKDARVDVSSLLIWSKHDKAFTQDTFQEIPKYVEDLTVKVIDTSSHSPFLDHTDLVLSYIQAFLDK